MFKEQHKEFLLGRAGADKVRHSGRTLYDHLVGTHDLLEAWGNSEAVCDAGLFHSIYGTGSFQHKSWPLSDRATIKALIGPEAETLVFTFCISDRRKLFPRMVAPIGRMLREIEAANLIEQGSKSASYLVRLRHSDISESAKRNIKLYLSTREVASADG